MDPINLDRLAELDAHATPGPWYWAYFDDEHCMSAISVEASVVDKSGVESTQRIAATLIQQPNYVVPDDARWSENAHLIAEVRSALPELLRLASLGLAAEKSA